MHALSAKRNEHFWYGAEDIFVDLNDPRIDYPNLESFPSFGRLIKAIKDQKYSHVFVDLELGRAFDDEEALQTKLMHHYGEDARHVSWGLTDSSDFNCFFPALTGDILDAAFRRDKGLSSAVSDEIDHRVERLRRENPYASGGDPFIQESILQELLERNQAKEKEDRDRRRPTEALYRIAPDKTGLLMDEELGWFRKARSAERFAWAEERLAALGFEKRIEGRLISYERRIAGYRLYADPRGEGAIEIQIFPELPQERVKGRKPRTVYIRPITIQDSWRHNLENKLITRFEESLKSSPHVETRD